MIETSTAKALGWGMALFLPGTAVAVFFFVAGLPSVAILGALVGVAGWISLAAGATTLAAKVDELYRIQMTQPSSATDT